MNEWEDIGYSQGGTESSEADTSMEEIPDEFGRATWDHVERRSEPAAVPPSSVSGEEDHACVRVLEGHSKGITALYFENECLVSFTSQIYTSLRAQNTTLGNWRIRQNHSSMGPKHGTMCNDDGHPMGNVKFTSDIICVCS